MNCDRGSFPTDCQGFGLASLSGFGLHLEQIWGSDCTLASAESCVHFRVLHERKSYFSLQSLQNFLLPLQQLINFP